MVKLLVMTDLHLVAPGGTIIGLDPLDRFTQGLAHAARTHPDADRLILMGDLTNAGDPLAYAALKDALDDAPWPVTMMMGNHDDRAVFRKTFPDHPVDADGRIQTITDYDDCRVVTLDTLSANPSPPESGHLCPNRLAWLKDALTSDRPCLVFLHHPPFDTGFSGMDAISLQNRQDFWDIIQTGQVAHIFAGHIHRTITATVAGHPVTVFKSPCHQMPMLLEQDGFGHSVDEPGAYGIVLTRGAEIVVHFEDFTLPTTPVAQFDL